MKFCKNSITYLTLSIAFCSATLSILVSSKVHCHIADNETFAAQKSPNNRLLILAAVGSTTSESFIRFNQSAEAFGLSAELLIIDQTTDTNTTAAVDTSREWLKFERLHSALDKRRGERDLVVLLVDGTKSIINGGQAEILQRFSELSEASGAELIFSSSAVCWPADLTGLCNGGDNDDSDEPTSGQASLRGYLSSRALIGTARATAALFDAIARAVSDGQQSGNKNRAQFDFQREAARLYLNESERKKLSVALDHKSQLLQSLHPRRAHAEDEVELAYDRPDVVRVKNLAHNTWPLVVHANGLGSIALNSLGNYLGKAWTPSAGCRHCNASKISLAGLKHSDMPRVLLAIFIDEPTPFMELFWQSVTSLDYPTGQIHLLVYNAVEFHSASVDEFLRAHASKYASHELVSAVLPNGEPRPAWQARDYSLKMCRQLGCNYYLSLDSLARLERELTLRELIETNRTVVAPMLSRPNKLWSNFWAALSAEGFYSRSHDYVELVSGQRRSVWNVPLVMNCYLIEGNFLRHWLEGTPDASKFHDELHASVKAELILSRNLRQESVWQFASNEHEFGHLVDPSGYNLSLVRPDFYELERNSLDWQQVYMHEQYFDLFDERDEDEGNPSRIRLESPCQDVYWFPLVSEQFCKHLIEIMEAFGQWSPGNNHDPRIEGGYESVPTRDIHFRQVGLHQMWLYFLRQFVMPIQLKEYIGYEHDPPRADLAFVVRYHPNEQASLRPHHDSSTYTINIALNEPGRDYQGGGCRFVRYNCSVTESRLGWALIHPGRLTHYHEGLPVTQGTRYIMVTFVDP